jgi:formylglycine-generating enzyme required for sulfatase activity
MDDERKAVRKFFKDYNLRIANQSNLEFKVVDWENYSDIGLGRPQQLITKQTLEKYKDSLVLFIGLLGQRFGTPTGNSESGTEEEFQIALAYRNEHGDYPEIKWFFREQWSNAGIPTDPDVLREVTEQLEKVKIFKDGLWKEAEQQAYTQSFKTSDEFPNILEHDLQRWLSNLERPWNQTPDEHATKNNQSVSTSPVSPSPYFAAWQRLLAAECARLPLEALDPRQGLEHTANPIQLPDIFVPLNAIAPTKKWLNAEHSNVQLIQEMSSAQRGDSAAEPEPVMALLEHHRLAVLLGDPGSGKSVMLNQLCWQQIENPDALPDYLRGCLPVRIILRRVAIPATAIEGKAAWIWDALQADIAEHLDNNDNAAAVITYLRQRLVEQSTGLILLDGLDEVSGSETANKHHSHRSLLLQAINKLITELLDTTRFIVSARPYAYTDPRWRLLNFTTLILTSFDKDQRQQFIESWYSAAKQRFGLHDETLKQRVPELLQQVEEKQHLRELAERPLLLTLIATLHASGKRMPEDRAELYEESVNLLLYQWRNAKDFTANTEQSLHIDESTLRGCLQKLAYTAHHEQGLQTKHSNNSADINEEQLLKAFAPLLKTMGSEHLLTYLQQHSGILIARDNDQFAFPHRSFQEYLAMGWLTAQPDDEFSKTVRANPLWWREVFLLALLNQRKTPKFAISYIQELLENQTTPASDNQQRLLMLAGLGLIELGLTGWNNNDFQTQRDRIRQGIVTLLKNHDTLNIPERAEAGRVLGNIGDSRPGTGLNAEGIPDIDWKLIPAGEITLEDNAGTLPVEAFHLARYPVTNAQFQAFVDDPDGYSNQQWWNGLDQQLSKPKSFGWSNANHPRETVSWFEAMAFCAWLSARLDKDIRLPTEWQWQQTACSTNPDFTYPWGEKFQSGYANIDETEDKTGPHYLHRTTAVGIYPQGDSQQGVSDLSGNVWEWCLNTYENPNNSSLSGTDSRVVRGGSWVGGSDNARASCRYFIRPGGRYFSIGFRLCCFSPI